MRPIRAIRDVDTLQQVASILDTENARLHKLVAELSRELAEARGGASQKWLALELAKLEEQSHNLRHRLFGDSSEKRPRDGDAGDAAPADPVSRHPGRTEQPDLPIDEVVHELASDARGCPSCGGELIEWRGQYEESEEITVVERSFRLVKHRRRKYRCRCYGAVAVAPGPRKLAPGARYSLEFAASTVVSKFGDHQPWERQRRIMAREGLAVTTQALWDANRMLAEHCRPTYDAIGRSILASPVVMADETWWRQMGDRSRSKWWAWHLATPDAVYMWIDPERSIKAASRMLEGYRGTLVVDGYGAYTGLQRAGPTFRLAHCWVHTRRKWVEAEPFYRQQCGEILDLIGRMYGVERRLAQECAGPEEVLAVRQAESKPIVEEIRRRALAMPSTRESALRKAIEYMLGRWAGLTVFLEDPAVPLDTNLVERAIRSPAMGRRNYFGSRSKRGIEVASIFHSLIQTARLNDVEPRRYILAVAERAIDEPGTVTMPSDLD